MYNAVVRPNREPKGSSKAGACLTPYNERKTPYYVYETDNVGMQTNVRKKGKYKTPFRSGFTTTLLYEMIANPYYILIVRIYLVYVYYVQITLI